MFNEMSTRTLGAAGERMQTFAISGRAKEDDVTGRRRTIGA
jgi:hypothetical protein